MIITESKPLAELIPLLEGKSAILIIGCNVCAAKMHTGGEPEIEALTSALTKRGFNVIGSILPTAACSIRSFEALAEKNERIKEADCILVMACGSGISVIADVVSVPVFGTTNTVSLGGRLGGATLNYLCSMCGQCNVGSFGGICPKTGCPKSQMNGPCGGSSGGKCEVDPERECVWNMIEKKLEETGRLEDLETIAPPRDYRFSKNRTGGL